MAWTTPKLWTNGETLTAADLNTYLRDNMLETEAAVAYTPGALIMATGANKIEERQWYIATLETNSVESIAGTNPASTYFDLDTVGPVVTCKTGTAALIITSMQSSSDKASTAFDFNHVASAAVKVSGATSITALASNTAMHNGQGNDAVQQFSCMSYIDNLNPGTNTFTMQYRCFPNGNTASFQNRTLIVLPL